ncbi:alkaline phosphatase D family protein [Prauserella alba]|uniref:Phospholipase D N-terminal domain-containing protein n=1 Tax=Prauserella alba TaxID=176898 RepID=A0ABN1VB90_9PSEU|nr:PhoD-like phosphatase N-terminal domain-containing protein [Prauserella alba]
MNGFDRRRFLELGGAAGAALAAGGLNTGWTWASPAERSRFTGHPFALGVASGDPLPSGVVLWTRLAPDPLAEDGSGGMRGRGVVPVRWEVAEDELFAGRVAHGVVNAIPELGHSVHVEVDTLRPDREYFYRFRVGGEISAVGRTRTAPAADANVDALAFAFVSCQNYPAG